MTKINFEIYKKREKQFIRAYAVICLVVILSMGFFTYTKWNEYSYAKVIVEENKKLISVMKENLTEETTDYAAQKDDFAVLQKNIGNKLEDIFPREDDYQNLTRQFDSFEELISTKNNPFEVSNISFLNVVEDEYFKILPVRMSIRSSKENFTKFLHLIESSGSFEENVRLMDISSIRLNFEEVEGKGLINFTVQINAYFRK